MLKILSGLDINSLNEKVYLIEKAFNNKKYY